MGYYIYNYVYIYIDWLVVWNMNFIFPIILGISSSQLTFTHSIIFQRARAQPPTSDLTGESSEGTRARAARGSFVFWAFIIVEAEL